MKTSRSTDVRRRRTMIMVRRGESTENDSLDQLFVGHDLVGPRRELAINALIRNDAGMSPFRVATSSSPDSSHWRRARSDSMPMNRFRALLASYLVKSSVRGLGTTALHPARQANTRQRAPFAPNSHDFFSRRRARPPAFDRIGGIVVASVEGWPVVTRRRSGFVLAVKAIVERVQ